MLILLHRAKLNAGDYLIADRAEALLRAVYPDETIAIGDASRQLSDQFGPEVLAKARAIVIGGGPGYQMNMYPDVYPLWPNLRDAESFPPLVLLALGSAIVPGTTSQLERFRFSSLSRGFLNSVLRRSRYLGARDTLTARLLAVNGYEQTLMTGDPAWYDLKYDLEHALTHVGALREFRSFAFTPPARNLYQAQATALLMRILGEWPASRCVIVSHRDAQTYWRSVAAYSGCEWADISGSSAGFEIYDTVDCHVGYRVHAHLYALSHARCTYLVAEDSRGRGVHETLGMLGAMGYVDEAQSIMGDLPARMARGLRASRIRGTSRMGGIVERPARQWLIPEDAVLVESVVGQMVGDIEAGFPRHQQAVDQIRSTLPTMHRMLESLPT